jgi:biopolymer transport protein TolR
VSAAAESPGQRLRAIRALIGAEQARARPGLKSDINVTPLVDVVLVLLIIFMVVTPLIASGVAVDLPRALNHFRKADAGKDIIISVTQDKRLYLGSTRVPDIQDLAAMTRAEKRRFPDKTLFIKGDARAPYGVMREVMQVLHESQIEDIVLGTEELKSPH